MTEPFPQLLWSKNYDGEWGIEKVGKWGSDWVGVGDKTYWKQYRKEKTEYDNKYKNTEWADKTPCPPEFKKRIKMIYPVSKKQLELIKLNYLLTKK